MGSESYIRLRLKALSRSQLAKFLRLAAVLLACLSTPTLRDVIGAEWLNDVLAGVRALCLWTSRHGACDCE